MTRSPLRACRARRPDHATGADHAYIDDHTLLMIATLVVIPLIVFKRASAVRGSGHVGGVEL
jgi:hypothetical protein